MSTAQRLTAKAKANNAMNLRYKNGKLYSFNFRLNTLLMIGNSEKGQLTCWA